MHLKQSPFVTVECTTKVGFHLLPFLIVKCWAIENLVNLKVVAELLSFEILKRSGDGFVLRQ